MRVLVAFALLGLLAWTSSASARDAGGHEQPSRFALREARVEPVVAIADERFQLRGQVVSYGGAESMEAMGFRLKSELVGKGSGCTVPAAIFRDGFE